MLNSTRTALQPLVDILNQIEDAELPKPKSPVRVIEKLARHAGVYPIPNLAVDICEKRFQSAVTDATEEGRSISLIQLAGKLAYCNAMPRPSGASNIRDFIACVLYGMSVNIISGPEGTRLLYGAQIAHSALAKRHQKRGK